MVIFGPAGSCDEVVESKMKRPAQAQFLREMGLKAYEHPFTFGVNINEQTKQDLIQEFGDFELSVHAPYYINFASDDEEKLMKTNGYLMDSVLKAREIGADRVVFHPGSLTGQTREQALSNTLKNLKNFVALMDERNIHDVYICPETMGKHGQVGTWEEVAKMCEIDERIIPCLDFGHINAFTLGGLDSLSAIEEIIKKFVVELKKKEIHIHFSRIEYTSKGEKKHLILDDPSDFGPDYKMMIDILKKYDANYRVISESQGTQSRDSYKMLEYYKK